MLGHWEEAQLYEWLIITQQNSLAVTYANIRFKMAEILDKNVSEDIVGWAFKKCDISNCLSGSKDHLIYDDDDDENSDDESDRDNNSNEGDESDEGDKSDDDDDESGNEDMAESYK
ncbi:20106_t:CDS:2 [Cetraspora pellucida]|uniref:20106_t:CDS:1 n=1 Tax=Cetraspora pellucida TaxID=1433469 RepID=A0A9N9ELE9_9GLOM|nr:20106_t:CDS:2 [Cetraspora pellucida]